MGARACLGRVSVKLRFAGAGRAQPELIHSECVPLLLLPKVCRLAAAEGRLGLSMPVILEAQKAVLLSL